MTYEEYYQEYYPLLKETEEKLVNLVKEYPLHNPVGEYEPVLYCKSRIKTPKSMIGKLQRRGLLTDKDTAMREMHDAVGIRVICSFADNVYQVADWLCGREEFEVENRKDYMSYPKPNGYRSLHLILKVRTDSGDILWAEIQLRTIAIDFWAALEHQIKYKHEIRHEKVIRDELKRCADEIASVDMSMQTIRDMIREE